MLSTYTFSGVADFGYDFYLLAIASLAVGIAKLLHGQYYRLLDFYFHTLIQQRPNNPASLLPSGKMASSLLMKLFNLSLVKFSLAAQSRQR